MARPRTPSPARLASPTLAEPLLEDDETEDAEEEGGLHAMPPGASSAEPVVRELCVAPTQHGQRLDVFLAAEVTEFSRNHLKSLIEGGSVVLAGVVALSASRKVAAGQVVSVTLKPTAQSQAFVAEPMDLDVVFEDAHLMVVNKPAGLVVHPAAGNWTGTLMNGLLAHHSGASELPRAGIVHRLDKDTSGLMVVGKTLAAVTALSRAIAAREVSRQYLSLVQGEAPAAFTVEAPIGRDPVTRVKMAVVGSGKPARTDVQRLLLAQWAPVQPGATVSQRVAPRWYSGVLCTLHTGRTHQIRVHLSSRKHPLVADTLYGGSPALGMTRQALHATRLAFTHPVTGEALKFEAPLPEDMASAWSLLESALAA
jgi:23S rRNA pseudouridine1911/1915/1917 synthase